ncbi:outer membrane beta-barrel domain-containing protein [Bdellovibrio sp. HCB337]|uniref:outer membrane beta-barrel domain-containing protein n=1 Tax=Bdellovibrio sp. HCB337 TaxID=3394358 RepID=UPI0039A71083
MKNFKTLTISALVLLSLNAHAAPKAAKKVAAAPQQAKQIDFSKDVDSLGGNDALMDMAERLNPETKSRIVQSRLVDRNLRLEIGVTMGGVMGGTTYLETSNVGASVDFHITPRWSIGARYYKYQNELSPEGKRIFSTADANAAAGQVSTTVDIDRPSNSTIGVINWYPMYGKINFFDAAIAQFDLYLLAGGGQIELQSGKTSVVTGGMGFGLWMTKHLTARAELRYQAYQDQIVSGPRNIDATVGTVGFGWIL